MNISQSAFVPENLVSRDGFGSLVPRQSAHLQIQSESGAYLRDSSRVPRRRLFIYLFICTVPTQMVRHKNSCAGENCVVQSCLKVVQ